MRATMQGSTFYKVEDTIIRGSVAASMLALARGLPKRSVGLGLSLVLVLALLFFEAYAGNKETVKIFSLLPPDIALKKVTLPELGDSLVYGISWRFRWKTLEPREGEYRWDLVDRALAETGKAGKKIMLRVVPGIHTPPWVYQAGAVPFEFDHTDLYHSENYKNHLKMPVPWDKVYLDKWEKFIQAFGKRYHGNPHLYSIPMAGGGHIGEMNLPKAIDQWRAMGYSDEKLITAWKRIIGAYQSAFPNIPTNLAINEPLRRKKSHVMEPIVNWVLATYPGKVYLQQNGLKASVPRDSRIRQIIRSASGQTKVGYQMVGGKRFLDEAVGDRKKAFQNAIEDHVSYLEVYASDIRDPVYRPALQFLATSVVGKPISK